MKSLNFKFKWFYHRLYWYYREKTEITSVIEGVLLSTKNKCRKDAININKISRELDETLKDIENTELV